MELLQRLRNVDIYNWMLLVLAVLTVLGLYSFAASGFASTIPVAALQVLATIVVGLALDTVLIYAREKKLRLSKSAIISGFFVGLVFSPLPSIAIPVAGIAIAILQKHILRFNNRPLFNPASFGLVAAGLLLGADHGWWAATMLPAVLILGLFIVVIFGRLHLVAPYLAAYWLGSLVLYAAGIGPPGAFSGVLLDGTMFFFAFLMLIEPRTSPAIKKGRIAYGAIAGLLATIFLGLGVPFYIPLNLLAANLFTRPLEKYFRPKTSSSQPLPQPSVPAGTPSSSP